jgi:hypothetical protein
VVTLPLASVAVHVTVVFPIGKIPPVGALLVNVMLFGAVQLSATAGAVKTIVAVQLAPALAVIVAGAVITGAIASVTVTVCVLVELLPLASVAVQVTVVTPTGNKPLAGALLVNVTGLVQLSVAVGAVNTTTALQLAPAVAVIATGVLITGAVVSVTVTNCVFVTVFPAASVAVHVTTVFPIGKIPPVGALLLNVTPVQLSAAVGAVNTTVAVHPTPAVAVIATGVVNVGAVTSITVTI